MEKKWYVIYVRQGKELKVAALFNKNKIENFCPVNRIGVKAQGIDKFISEPLFSTYVFVHIHEIDICQIQKLNHVLSIFHLKDMPAIVREEEINILREFTLLYTDIKFEKMPVGIKNEFAITNDSIDFIGENMYAIRNDFVRIHLPSLGFLMIAPIKTQPTTKENLLLPKSLAKQFQLNFFNF